MLKGIVIGMIIWSAVVTVATLLSEESNWKYEDEIKFFSTGICGWCVYLVTMVIYYTGLAARHKYYRCEYRETRDLNYYCTRYDYDKRKVSERVWFIGNRVSKSEIKSEGLTYWKEKELAR